MHGFLKPQIWIRLLLLMFSFWLLGLAISMLGMLTALQGLMLLWQQKRHPFLSKFQQALFLYSKDLLSFVSMDSDQPPFPFESSWKSFSDW